MCRRVCCFLIGLLIRIGEVGNARRLALGGQGGGNSPFAANVDVHFGVKFDGDDATRTKGSGPPLIVSIGFILIILALRGVSGTGCCWLSRQRTLSSNEVDDEASSATPPVLTEILNDGVADLRFLAGLSRNCIGNGDDSDFAGGMDLFGEARSFSTSFGSAAVALG